MQAAIKTFISRIDGEAWLRFFLAVAGLGLAFVAAVFSSVARDSGNNMGSVAFATTALLLSGIVGMLTVPYLARRVAAARVRDALDYELTREGLAYLGVALVIGVAALNTGNNLLFIVLSAMLAAIAVSGVASAAVLRGLELDLVAPRNAFAKKPIAVRVCLHNPRWWMPAFSVRVFSPDDKKARRRSLWEWKKTEFIFPKKTQWLRLPDYTLGRRRPRPRQPKILARPVYFPFVGTGGTAVAEVDLAFPRRGRYTQEGFSLATRFPFSFLTKSRKVQLEREMVVYPALLESDDFLDVLPLITGEFVSFVRGRGTELYLIRDITPDDPGRYVDWKATAKTGALKVREFTREDERRLRIVFDNPGKERVSPAGYENAVSMVASLACHFAEEHVDLSFAATGYHGDNNLEEFLTYLASIQADESTLPGGETTFLDDLPMSVDYNVIVTSRKPGSLPSKLWVSSYVIYMNK